MAETLSIVAAAFQLTDSAIKLSKAWIGIKDMPDNIRNLIEDVNLLADTLHQIQSDPLLQSNMHQITPAWTLCFNTLRKVNSEFKKLVDDLNGIINVHRNTGSIKAFLKREKLSEYRVRLESLKTNMLLLQQEHARAIMTQQSSLVAQQYSLLMQAIQTQRLPEGSTPQSIGPAVSATDAEDLDVLGDQPLTNSSKRTTQSRRSQSSAKNFEFYLPQWLSRKRMQLLVDHSYGSWSINLRIYNRIPSYSRIFLAAKSRDWDKVQRMFVEKSASPFDVNEHGLSLLHVAASIGDYRGCEFLLKHGLDPHVLSNMMQSPLTQCGVCNFHHDGTDTMKVVRLLSASFNDYLLNGREVFPFWFFPSEAVRYLITMESSIYHTTLPLSRARALLRLFYPTPESIASILGPHLSFSEALAILSEYSFRQGGPNHRQVLRNISWSLATIVHDANTVQSFVGEWHPLIADLVLIERRTDQRLHGPLTSIVSHYILMCIRRGKISLEPNQHGSIWTLKLTAAIRIWIEVLIKMGVNMESYAVAERDFFRDTAPFFHWASSKLGKEVQFRINGFTCGPSLEDWVFYAVPAGAHPEYEMAGAFWQWIENPELFSIPGAFADEPDDYDQDFLGSDRYVYSTCGPIL